MLAGMKQIVKTTPKLEKHFFDAAMGATDVFTFDDQFTAKISGYADGTSYYAATSVHRRLSHLKIPALIIQSTNDPWIPAAPCLAQPTGVGLPAIVVPDGGGHVGFHDRDGSWYIRATLAWVTAHLGKKQNVVRSNAKTTRKALPEA